MGWTAGALPLFWAQAAATTTGSAIQTSPIALAPLALRRWFASLTLSSPESVPSLFGVWVWLASLGGLLVLALVFQGPGRALAQLVDLPGQARLVAASTRRLQRAYRMLVVTVGLSVLSWTGSQSLTFDKPSGRDDVIQLTRARHLVELAVEQGALAALTPLRDVAGLSSNLPLLLLGTLLLFRASSDIWTGSISPSWLKGPSTRDSGWANVGWSCGALMILYRLVSLGAGNSDLPLGGCLMIEALMIPAVMAIADGLLLGWVLAELRDAGFGNRDADAFESQSAVGFLPGSIVACVAALPARYLATFVLLAWTYLPSWVDTTMVGSYVRWQLGHGLADVQGAALLVAGLAGSVAWSGGGLGEAFRGYGRLLSSQGARLVVVFGLSGLAAGVVSAVAYAVVLSLPSSPWLLNAADSYAHYGTLPIGLWALSALVELGEGSRSESALVAENGRDRLVA